MATPGEKRALMFLGAVIVLGAGMRAAGGTGTSDTADPRSVAAVDKQIAAVDSAKRAGKRKRVSGRGRKARKKVEATVPAIIDLDVATAEEIETLRGVGPALARRIVANRDSLGPFGSLEQLERVRGIGPRLAAKLDSSVTFSLLPRPSTTEMTRSSTAPKGRRKARRGDTDS